MKINTSSSIARVLFCGCAVATLCSFAVSEGATFSNIPSTDPNRTAAVVSPAEQAYVSQMQGVVASSKSKGALDVTAMSGVFRSAIQAGVKPEVVGKMVASVVNAYPDSASQVASSVALAAGRTPSMLMCWHTMNSAVMSSPRPFTTVIPVRDAMLKNVDNTKLIGIDEYIKYAAIRIASATPDNPLNDVAYNKAQIGTELEQQGLAIKQMYAGFRTYGALFLETEVGITPFGPAEVSPPSPPSPPSPVSPN